MAWVLDQCLILLHPIMPFITEELWATTGTRAKMLVHADWPNYGAELHDNAAQSEMNWVITLIDEIRSARAQMHVPVGLKLPMLSLTMTADATAYWGRNEPLITRLARIDSLTPADAAPKGAITVPVEGATFAIPLAGVIDIAEEKSRLQKSLDKLAKEIDGPQRSPHQPQLRQIRPGRGRRRSPRQSDARQDEAAKLQSALVRLSEMG